jgi:Tol biopolymer transport system component
LFVMNADGTNQTLLLENPLSAEDWIWMGGPARWSPDGEKILFKTYSTVDDLSGKIWVVNSDGSNPQVLLDFPDADEGAAAWSPDGTKIAFSSDIGGDHDLYVMNADGTNVQALTDNNSDDGSASWSPDGAQIAFMSDRDGDWEIYVMNSDGSYQQNITNSPASDDGNPGWGP